MTGAEIVGACREATMYAIRESKGNNDKPTLSQQMLEDALSRLRPLVRSPAVMNEYLSFERAHRRPFINDQQ